MGAAEEMARKRKSAEQMYSFYHTQIEKERERCRMDTPEGQTYFALVSWFYNTMFEISVSIECSDVYTQEEKDAQLTIRGDMTYKLFVAKEQAAGLWPWNSELVKKMFKPSNK